MRWVRRGSALGHYRRWRWRFPAVAAGASTDLLHMRLERLPRRLRAAVRSPGLFARSIAPSARATAIRFAGQYFRPPSDRRTAKVADTPPRRPMIAPGLVCFLRGSF